MRLLLDTNIIIPIVRRPVGVLPNDIGELLRRGHDEISCSTVSIWEIAIKWRLGKLSLDGSLEDLIHALDLLGVAIIALTPEQAIAEADPRPATRDPFDRLLLAICAVEGFRLVTTDRVLAAHPLAWRAAP